jgi:DNA-directed RNA polymerase
MAVVAAAREGIKDFALVHDSFGTHAADTGRFFSILRETMVDIYTTTDVMQDFHDQMSGQISEENLANLPVPPARGKLDLTAVLNSDFAFA